MKVTVKEVEFSLWFPLLSIVLAKIVFVPFCKLTFIAKLPLSSELVWSDESLKNIFMVVLGEAVPLTIIDFWFVNWGGAERVGTKSRLLWVVVGSLDDRLNNPINLEKAGMPKIRPRIIMRIVKPPKIMALFMLFFSSTWANLE